MRRTSPGLVGPAPHPICPGFAAVPTDPDIVWLAGSNGVWRSEDGGTTWTALDDGLVNRYVTDIAIDATGTHVHAGTWGGEYDLQIG